MARTRRGPLREIHGIRIERCADAGLRITHVSSASGEDDRHPVKSEWQMRHQFWITTFAGCLRPVEHEHIVHSAGGLRAHA